jgi:hypothetical protein
VAAARRSGAGPTFFQELLDHVEFHVALGQQPLEPGVLLFQFLEPPDLVLGQAAVLAPPP